MSDEPFAAEISKIQTWLNWRNSPLKLNSQDPITVTSYSTERDALVDTIKKEFPDLSYIKIDTHPNKYVKTLLYIWFN